MGEIKKQCPRCHKDRALSDYRPNPCNEDGFNKTCNNCADYSNHWVKANPERAKYFRDKWRVANPEKHREQAEKWKKNNPDKVYEMGIRRNSQKELKNFQSGIDFALSQLAGIVDQKIIDSIQSSEVTNA